MRTLVYAVIGLFLSLSYVIPVLQKMVMSNKEMATYRVIAIILVFARLVIEGLSVSSKLRRQAKVVEQNHELIAHVATLEHQLRSRS